MNKFLIAGSLVLLTLGGMLFSNMHKESIVSWEGISPKMMSEWRMWKSQFGKMYSDEVEEVYRFQVWLNNLKYIMENQGVEYTLGLNLFADMTTEEWRSAYLMEKGVIQNYHTEPENVFEYDSSVAAPTTMNWVTQNKTVTVLNQGQCGSCWAFSTVESIDSAYAVTLGTNPVPNLSEQQVVSCSYITYGVFGCNGGNVIPAYKYVMAHPLTTNANYPYTSGNTQKTGTCNTQLQNQGTYKITGYKTIPSGNCDALMNANAITPTAVCVDASTWQLYTSGIFSNCGTQLDHCVLLAGYVQNQYWLIQNSWTTQWGEQGFMQLAWGNTCGVCQQAQYPTVN